MATAWPIKCPSCGHPFYRYNRKTDFLVCLKCECAWQTKETISGEFARWCGQRRKLRPVALDAETAMLYECLVTAMAENCLELIAGPNIYLTRALEIFQQHGGLVKEP